MVHNIKFRNVNNKFQNKLNKNISKIKKLTKTFIPADKTSKFYKLDKTQHDKLLRDSITTTYKKLTLAPPTSLTHKQNLLPKSSKLTTTQNKLQNNKLILP